MKLGEARPTGSLNRGDGETSCSSEVWLVLVEFQDGYNTHRWGGLYTNAKHLGKWACRSKRSRVHTNLATTGSGRKLSAWAITIWGNNGWFLMREFGTSPKNVRMGMDSQVCQLVTDGYGRWLTARSISDRGWSVIQWWGFTRGCGA